MHNLQSGFQVPQRCFESLVKSLFLYPGTTRARFCSQVSPSATWILARDLMRTAVFNSSRSIFGFATITFQELQLLSGAMMSSLRGLSSRGHSAIQVVDLILLLVVCW